MRRASFFLNIAVAAGLVLSAGTAGAEVTSRTRIKNHSVYGKSEHDLVVSMFRYAIRRKGVDVVLGMLTMRAPSVVFNAQQTPRGCKLSNFKTRLDFTMTLPQARDRRRLSGKTEASWKQFTAFVKRHEEQHRSYIIECARRYERSASRQSPKNCASARRDVAKVFLAEMKRCGALHAALDRRDGQKLERLPLFAEALRKPSIATLAAKAREGMKDPTTQALLRRQ
ncbi:putative secreted Zn-dependent protease [Breoghania corrubedonensis]|uniref:Putative secreted Zn-dependent protease n=1 Tax=Breoghania corrubedonensis TaxID=665038 RepID=A0A2T5V8I6_9HYPH|nr:DUF922 domain-containing protein [Breoghania corrubedonensis]PTW60075.1 putative secreted Zn-dependent protease [Breoghania corrubedonensis]